MIASLDMATLFNEAHKVGELILSSAEAKHYKACKHALEKDQDVQLLVKSFMQKKEMFEEVQRFGKYHPDYKRLNKEMRECKRTLDMNDTVAHFKKAERELESILNEISQIVAYAVSEEIKVPTGNPFWDSTGCGGSGCGSGSCGCGNS